MGAAAKAKTLMEAEGVGAARALGALAVAADHWAPPLKEPSAAAPRAVVVRVVAPLPVDAAAAAVVVAPLPVDAAAAAVAVARVVASTAAAALVVAVRARAAVARQAVQAAARARSWCHPHRRSSALDAICRCNLSLEWGRS